MADHLRALRLAARQRAGRPVEAEVAQADLHERVEGLTQRRQQRRHGRLVQAADPVGEVADLHRAGVADVLAVDLRRARRLREPRAVAVRAGREHHRPLHEGADVRLHRVDVLGEERLLDLRDQARVGEVDPVDLDLGRLAVEQVVPLALGELPDRLVRVEVAAAAEDPAVPALHAVARDRERALVERLVLVIERAEVEVGDRAAPLAARAHAARAGVGRLLGPRLAAALDRDPAARLDRGDVEGVRAGRADVRLREPAEDDPQHRVGVRGRPDRGARVGAHPLLVDEDRGRQPFEQVDLGPRQRRHEALDERAVGLVDQPLGLRRDRAEHERALPGARDAGEHGQPPLRDLDADVLEVVHPRAVDADQVMGVGVDRAHRRHGSRGPAGALLDS